MPAKSLPKAAINKSITHVGDSRYCAILISAQCLWNMSPDFCVCVWSEVEWGWVECVICLPIVCNHVCVCRCACVCVCVACGKHKLDTVENPGRAKCASKPDTHKSWRQSCSTSWWRESWKLSCMPLSPSMSMASSSLRTLWPSCGSREQKEELTLSTVPIFFLPLRTEGGAGLIEEQRGKN